MDNANFSAFAGRYMPAPIGLPGFDLPDVTSFLRVPFDELSSIKNFSVEGTSAAGDNFALVPPGYTPALPLRIRIAGHTSRALLVIGDGSRLFGQITISGPEHTAIFAGADEGGSAQIIEMNGRKNCFFLGRSSSSNGLSSFVVGNDISVCLGEHLLCAHHVKILTSDMHSLIDARDNHWVNPPAGVRIDPHVWLAEESTILKGSSIGFGSVLAIGSILTKPIGSRCIAAGVPAKIIRENTTWLTHSTPNPKQLKALAELEERFFAASKTKHQTSI